MRYTPRAMAHQYIFTMQNLRKVVPPQREILKGYLLECSYVGNRGAWINAGGGLTTYNAINVTDLPHALAGANIDVLAFDACFMQEMEIAYELNPLLVRGLDYYNRTVFEFYGQREGAQASLGGGGRYDQLVETLGGTPTPAFGFGIGLERLLLETEAAGVLPAPNMSKRVYIVSIGEPARLASFKLIEELLNAGIAATGSVDRDGIGGQLARASKLGVPYAVIMGQKEVQEGTVLLRDMSNTAQETLPLKGIIPELAKRFS